MRIMAKKKPSPDDLARGQRLQAARDAAGLTQKKAAEALTKRGHRNKFGEPVGESNIGNWEQGTRFPRDLAILKDLAEIYGTYVSCLLDLPEAPVDRRIGQIIEVYKQTDERGRDAIWRIAESQPAETRTAIGTRINDD